MLSWPDKKCYRVLRAWFVCSGPVEEKSSSPSGPMGEDLTSRRGSSVMTRPNTRWTPWCRPASVVSLRRACSVSCETSFPSLRLTTRGPRPPRISWCGTVSCRRLSTRTASGSTQPTPMPCCVIGTGGHWRVTCRDLRRNCPTEFAAQRADQTDLRVRDARGSRGTAVLVPRNALAGHRRVVRSPTLGTPRWNIPR